MPIQRFLAPAAILVSTTAFGQQATSELNFTQSDVKYNDTAAHARTIDFRTYYPILKTTHSRIIGNVIYTNESFSDFPEGYGNSLHGISTGLTWNRELGAKHNLAITGDVGLYTDFNEWTGKAIRERLSVTYLTRYSSRLSIGFGVAYRNQFYGDQIIPIVIVNYTFKNTDHWKISGVLPYTPKVTYIADKHNGISLSINQSFNSYLLTAQKDSGNYVKSRKISLQLNYEYSFNKDWRLNAGVGLAAKQVYELYSGSDPRKWYILNSAIGDKPTPLESISRRGIQFNIGLAFRPRF